MAKKPVVNPVKEQRKANNGSAYNAKRAEAMKMKGNMPKGKCK